MSRQSPVNGDFSPNPVVSAGTTPSRVAMTPWTSYSDWFQAVLITWPYQMRQKIRFFQHYWNCLPPRVKNHLWGTTLDCFNAHTLPNGLEDRVQELIESQ